MHRDVIGGIGQRQWQNLAKGPRKYRLRSIMNGLIVCFFVVFGITSLASAQDDSVSSYSRLWSIQAFVGGHYGLAIGDYFRYSKDAVGFHAGALLPLAKKIGISVAASRSYLAADDRELIKLAGEGQWDIVENNFQRQVTTFELSAAGFGSPKGVPSIFGYLYIGLGAGFYSKSGTFTARRRDNGEIFSYVPPAKWVLSDQFGASVSWFFTKSVGIFGEISFQGTVLGKSDSKNIDGRLGRFMVGLTCAFPRAH